MQVIRFERTGAIGHIILCNPPGNLIAVAFSEGLRQAVHEASESDVRVLLTRAEGPNFSQGGDVADLIERSGGWRHTTAGNSCTMGTRQWAKSKAWKRGGEQGGTDDRGHFSCSPYA